MDRSLQLQSQTTYLNIAGAFSLADDSACILSMTGVRVEPDCFPL
jgi:hypothetical protein